MDHNIFLLDISHLTSIDTSFFIKGEIVLSDNIDTSPLEPVEQLPQNNFPVQAGMSIVLFSLEGEMHIRISLKEYVLRPNMFCVIITGMIFEVLSINYDFRGFMIATRTDFMPTTNVAYSDQGGRIANEVFAHAARGDFSAFHRRSGEALPAGTKCEVLRGLVVHFS